MDVSELDTDADLARTGDVFIAHHPYDFSGGLNGTRRGREAEAQKDLGAEPDRAIGFYKNSPGADVRGKEIQNTFAVFVFKDDLGADRLPRIKTFFLDGFGKHFFLPTPASPSWLVSVFPQSKGNLPSFLLTQNAAAKKGVTRSYAFDFAQI